MRSSSQQNIGQYIGHLAAVCSYQHTSFPTILRVHIVQNSKEFIEIWIKYLKLKKNKMVEIQDGRYSSGFYKKMACPHMLGCPLYVWMSPYASLYVWTPPYVWMPLYVWVPPMFG